MFWAANTWHNVASLAGKADRIGGSTVLILNSKLLLVKRQERDTDPTPLHPRFPLLVPLVLVEWIEWIGVPPANSDSAHRVGMGVRIARVG